MEDFMGISAIVEQLNIIYKDELTGCRFEEDEEKTRVIFSYNDLFNLKTDITEVRSIIKDNCNDEPFNLTFDYEEKTFTIEY